MRKTERDLSSGSAAPPKRVLLMVSMEHAHGRNILQGIADYADHHAPWQHQLEVNIQPGPIDRGGVDGIIVEPRTGEVQEALRRSGVPVVTVTAVHGEHGLPAVVVDNQAVGRMAADHLADLGLKHLAFVPIPGALHSRDRAEGFIARAAARKVAVSVCDPSAVNDETTLAHWLRGLSDPVGILASNDRKALEVARACRLAGRRIPEQVALLGVDNEIETCWLTSPPLSSIDQGTRRIGYEAARLLDAWMTAGERPPATVLIQPIGVISRPSTDLLAIGDPEVVAAIRFIRSAVAEPLKVRDVLRHVALSRRSLELHFQRALGRTIHQEITRVRIDRAKQLLITSDWNMPYIADACGFAFHSQFSYAFKRETGMSPLKFRGQFRYRRVAS